jgi:hypothetical protein
VANVADEHYNNVWRGLPVEFSDPVSRGAAEVGNRTVDVFAVKSSCNLVKNTYIVVASMATFLKLGPSQGYIRLLLHHESKILSEWGLVIS